MDEPHFLTLVTDYADAYSDIPTLNKEILDYFESLGGDTLSAIWVPEGKNRIDLYQVCRTQFQKKSLHLTKKFHDYVKQNQ